MNTYHPPAIIDSADASRVLETEWHECTTCGAYVHNDDTTSTCNPWKVKEYKNYLRGQAKRKVIEARMAERQRKFDELQARDAELLYEISTGRRINR